MIHPGYGFLSENKDFAKKVEAAGIMFVGPTPQVIDMLGDKVKARDIAQKCKVPIVPGTKGAVNKASEAEEFVKEHGYPIIVKAAAGGGGRGMRVVREGENLQDAFERAVSEAKSAFGDGTVFIERFLERPKHIEVQLLGDGQGNVIHLFERDCSVQRRHQKVVEIAPSQLKHEIRDAILADAVKLASSVNYRNAGTAEFLVDKQDRHYFIEINPRIQVEHTITEEVTGIDIVAAQIRIAAGASLPQLGFTQDRISMRGFAIQCRVTTEDPSKHFQPDTGKIEVYRSAGGNGVRLDGGNGFAGAVISPHYDSMLVKCTCSGSTYEIARRKMLRALVEFRIRGVKTNIPFLASLLMHEVFISGSCWTTFIDDTPDLFTMMQSQNRAQKLLAYLGDVAVNGSSIKGQIGDPELKGEIILPILRETRSEKPLDISAPCEHGWRNILAKEGPEAFAKAIRENKGCLIMDTTWRDAHQSLLATRVRTCDILNIARQTSHAYSNAYSLECWGGATFDVAMRFLYEDPWERLRKMKALVPNIPFQMLLRGANGLAYSSLPDNAIYHFCEQAKANGIDIFRIFDALNDFSNLSVGIEAVKKAGGVVEAAMCYSGDMMKPGKKYNLDYYMNLAEKIVTQGTHILAIKDMAGTLKPRAATLLVGSLRKKYPNLPIHIHTHDSAGTGVTSMIACAEAGADVVDVATDSMSGMTSQPSIGAFLAALEGSGLDTGLTENYVREIDSYWAQLRLLYSPFEADLKGPDAEVYVHEIPGGQLTNLMFQAKQLGLGTQWKETKRAYTQANYLLGDIVKVTPTSKVVGDLAQYMVQNSLTFDDVSERAGELDFPGSVLDFFEGLMGQPYGGFPEPLRTKALRGQRKKLTERPGKSMPPMDFDKIKKDLKSKYGVVSECDVASYVQFPKVFEDFREFTNLYGDLSTLPTRYFLSSPEIGEEFSVEIDQGKVLIIKLLAVGPLSQQTGQREVFFELNGEVRQVGVDDKKAGVEQKSRPKADVSNPADVGAPMSGVVIELRVKEGQEVAKGTPVAVLSAMKMELVVSAQVGGKVSAVSVKENDSVEGQDLICKITKS